ncbi:fimbrial protein BcfF [Kluyvera intermedia]|jgi:type 1 fimbria pilin|uniref:Fimbrial protein BcfF n=1 Tax=Kluyvera intermedia TaxID=61648 RepID=A0ABX6DSJ9_KLUIN|nr:fimbrial protein BcfF [Kluyvera intermedia]QGH40505.1 fimbrial protein BcfF [Kluyvera intermedia]
MNLRFWGACIMVGSGLLSAASAHDGRVYVSGTITDNTCTLSPNSENLDVEMGSVSNRQFTHAGDGANWQPFSIDLQNCGSTASGVTVSFSGTANSHNPNLLALTPGDGDATGVAIGFYDKDKAAIPLGDESASQAISSGQASVHLQFYARYIADGGVVGPGIANASATFVLAYE